MYKCLLLLSAVCLMGVDAQAQSSIGCSTPDYTCFGKIGFCQAKVVRWCAPGTTCDPTWTPAKGGNNPCAIIIGKNIVQLAQSVPDLSTLVTAVVAGKLVTTLSSAGPFTVFAPTNESFAALPSATLTHLLDPKNIKELDSVLTYHVVSGNIQSKFLKPSQEVKTVQGASLKIVVRSGKVFVNNAQVTAADNEASNGVVHIINKVLIPPAGPTPAPASKNIVQLAQSVPDLSTLVTAVVAGKLATTLSSAGPFTVFAPTNEAFAKLPKATLAHLLAPGNIKELDALLTYHVISGNIQSKDLKPFQDVKTVQGGTVRVVVNDGNVYVNNAQVTAADNEASNGVVHIIDAVLTLPYSAAA